MRKKRPCRICRRWFLPDKHVGDRQEVCSRPECQRERHRRESVEYRRRERSKVREGRVVCRIRRDGVAESERPAEGSPLARLDWPGVRELVGLKHGVIIQETGKVILSGVRELVRSEVAGLIGKSQKVIKDGMREHMSPGRGVPYADVEGEAPHAGGPAPTESEIRGPEGPQPP